MTDRYRSRQRSNAVSATVGFIIILVGMSVVIPAIAVSVDGEQRHTFTQSEGERVVLTGALEATLEEVNSGTTGNVNVSITHRETGETNSTGTVDGGNSTTVVIDGQNITVYVGEVIDSSSATITYEYPLSLGLPEGTEVIVDNITLILLLSVVMLLVGIVMVIATKYF